MSRLASKPGVQSTLILSKNDGTVIQSTGLLAAADASTIDTQDGNSKGISLEGSAVASAEVSANGHVAEVRKGNTVEDVARMVFTFVTAAKAFSDGMCTSDDVKLLRMRTKKNEIVIVPGV